MAVNPLNILLDTSAFSAFGRSDDRLKATFSTENSLYMPLIVIGELRAGFAAGTRREHNEHFLQRFLDSPNVMTLTISDTTTVQYATIYAALRKVGRSINTNDLWIAALATEHNLPLATLDSDFSAIPHLKLAAI